MLVEEKEGVPKLRALLLTVTRVVGISPLPSAVRVRIAHGLAPRTGMATLGGGVKRPSRPWCARLSFIYVTFHPEFLPRHQASSCRFVRMSGGMPSVYFFPPESKQSRIGRDATRCVSSLSCFHRRVVDVGLGSSARDSLARHPPAPFWTVPSTNLSSKLAMFESGFMCLSNADF